MKTISKLILSIATIFTIPLLTIIPTLTGTLFTPDTSEVEHNYTESGIFARTIEPENFPEISQSAKFTSNHNTNNVANASSSNTASSKITCGGHWGNIVIDGWHSLAINTSDNTGCVPTSDVAIYTPTLSSKNTYLYAHNYGHVFGPIKSASSFTISNASGTKSYRIVTSEVYNLGSDDRRMMSDSINATNYLRSKGLNPSNRPAIAMMTCHGPGDSQRFVAYAIEQ